MKIVPAQSQFFKFVSFTANSNSKINCKLSRPVYYWKGSLEAEKKSEVESIIKWIKFDSSIWRYYDSPESVINNLLRIFILRRNVFGRLDRMLNAAIDANNGFSMDGDINQDKRWFKEINDLISLTIKEIEM